MNRRTAASNMIRAGVAQTVAMSITEHKTDSMFRRYNVSSNGDQRDAMRPQREYLAGGNVQPDSVEFSPRRAAAKNSENAGTERARH
jgi:hypothetical protein